MIIILMGVAGSGKTAIGRRLAGRLKWSFYDGDDFHPQTNVTKMARHEPLTPHDREAWLTALRELLTRLTQQPRCAVLACSALSKSFRESLCRGFSDIELVYLRGDVAVIRRRLQQRESHFFPADLLNSQFEALDPPHNAYTIDIAQTPEQIVEEILNSRLFSQSH